MTSISRRTFCGAALAGMGGLPGPAGAQQATWPARPVRLVVPGAPGGLFDVTARQLGERLAPGIDQSVVVDNRVGAGGLLGMQHVARSAPDGYTFGICSFTQLAVNPWMYDKPGYDPVADFSAVTALFHSPVVLAVRGDSALDSVAALLRQARQRPGRYTYASSGVGQPPHVLFELVEHRAGVHLVHIPYRGGPPAVAAVLAGDVDLIFEGSAGVMEQIRAGRLRPLAVTGERRVPQLPEVPTFGEAGVPDIDNSWMGVVAPAGTPADIVGRMQREIARVLATVEMQALYERGGRIPIGNSPEAFAAMVRIASPKWRELVRAAGLKPE